jgi:ribosome biogenesis GTPase
LDERTRKSLASRLAGLDKNEILKLYKRASMLRKTTRKAPKTGRGYDDLEDDAPVERRKPSATIEDLILKILEQEEVDTPGLGGARATGTVVWVGQKSCKVRIGGEDVACEICGALAKRQQTSVAVGDEASVEQGESLAIVRAIGPRRSQLSRPDPGNANRERVIAANVDLVVITVSIKSPPLHPRLIDRYLVAIQKGGAKAALCVNKLDLASDEADLEAEMEKLRPYEEAGVTVIGCSTETAEGSSELLRLIAGKTCAFVGHSGVGKSSILNMLHPDLGLDTGGVSEGYGRGRHTTTASSLFDLQHGTRLIDTPGIRSFGLWQMSPEELAGYFPEFEEPSSACRFRDCTHRGEPACGVKAAAEAGRISNYRYDTYLRLVEEVG